jgi:hypothetical protein
MIPEISMEGKLLPVGGGTYLNATCVLVKLRRGTNLPNAARSSVEQVLIADEHPIAEPEAMNDDDHVRAGCRF